MRAIYTFYQSGISHKRETLLPFIAYIYIHLYRKREEDYPGTIRHGRNGRRCVKSHLQDKLRKETGCTIEFSGHVEPELIGGFRLRIGITG